MTVSTGQPPSSPLAAGPEPVQLTYGRSRRSYRRLARWACLAVAVVLLALAAAHWLPRLEAHFRALRAQSELLGHQWPAGQPVWEEDPPQVRSLLYANMGYARRHVRNPRPNGFTAATRTVLGLDALGTGTGDCTPFVHGRSVPGGPPRLVVVHGHMITWEGFVSFSRGTRSAGFGRDMNLSVEVLQLGSVGRAPRVLRNQPAELVLKLNDHDRLRLYTGRPDPADPSRFTIDFDCNGVRGTIDGRLLGDDTVTLTPRDKQPGTPTASEWVPRGSKRAAPPTGPGDAAE